MGDMLRHAYRSYDEARAAFDEYVGIEPRLMSLWGLCRSAAPPERDADGDDTFDDDPFERDVASGAPDDGWCAEQFFDEHVKPLLRTLVGWDRPGEPHALHSSEAYEAVFDLLFNWGLRRDCSCCAEHDDDAVYAPDDPRPPAQW